MEIPKKPIEISYKVFVGTNTKDDEETAPTWTSLTLITKNVTIDLADNIKLFYFYLLN